MRRVVRLGVKNLLLHKLRSVLTTLGVLFGVASVVSMLAISEGASFEAQEKIRALGSTNIWIETRRPSDAELQRRGDARARTQQEFGITSDDIDALRTTLPEEASVVPIRSFQRKAEVGPRNKRVTVLGTTPHYQVVTNARVAEGRFLEDLDGAEMRNVAVLGAEVARALFPFESPIEQTVRIGAETFRVVGVLADPEKTAGGAEVTKTLEAVLLPIETVRAYFVDQNRPRRGNRSVTKPRLQRAVVQAISNGDVLPTARTVRALLAHRHDAMEDYTVTVPLELLRQAEDTARIFNIVLGSIAAISLIVGGIGIMNVMLATVTERTQEIGVRRALGARRSQILAQFLVETLVLSSGGGLLGVAFGLGLPALVTKFAEIKTIIQPGFAVIAFLISASVGVIFGLYPAWRAARMDPVEALRRV